MSAAEIGRPLDAEQLRRIRHGLRNSLRLRNFDEASIDRYAEEAIAKSLVELTEARRHGKVVPDPIAWVVKVSIWRSIDLLRQDERRVEAALSEEAAAELADRPAALPEDMALENLEAADLHRVVAELPVEQRQALRTYYFWELSTRAGAERLHWSEATFRRRLKAAINSLRDRFGIPEQGDALVIELGLAATLALRGDQAAATSPGGLVDHLVAGAEGLRGAVSSATHRVRDLVVRAIPGVGPGKEHPVDPVLVGRAAETAGGPGGAAAGKLIGGGCAVAVAICAASGVVGPGIGGVVGLLHRAGPDTVAPKVRARHQAVPTIPSPAQRVPSRKRSEQPAGGGAQASRARSSPASSERALGDEAGSPSERTHAANRALGVESEATPSEPAPAPAPEASSAPAESPRNPTREANEALGP